MKKTLFVILLLLLALLTNAVVMQIVASHVVIPSDISFRRSSLRGVEDFMHWIETGEKPHEIRQGVDFEPLLNFIRQNGSILTVEEVSGEFELFQIRVSPEGLITYTIRRFYTYNVADVIQVNLHLMDMRTVNFPTIYTTQVDEIQYAIAIENLQGEIVSLENQPLEQRNLSYWISPHGGITASFEIDGVYVEIIFSRIAPDGSFAALLDGWDNSVLDMFRFISRPITVNGNFRRNEIDIILDGTPIQSDVGAIMSNRFRFELTMVPFRSVLEALGMEVEWDNATRTAIATNDDIRLELDVDGATVVAYNEFGYRIQWDVHAMFHNNRAMVNLRFITDVTGASVREDAGTRTVIITTN